MALEALALQRGPFIHVNEALPVALVTGTGVDPRPRLRVDPAQTSFLEGRQFRVFHEFNIASGSQQWLRFVTPLDVVVLKRALTVVQGNLRFALGTGGTASGTWTAKTPFPVNNMSTLPLPLYTRQVTVDFGGTVTGMTERDVLLLETGSNQAVTVQALAEETGQAANTYYVELRNSGGNALRGVYSVVWEEVQPRSPSI